jgi:hypothetical protein
MISLASFRRVLSPSHSGRKDLVNLRSIICVNPRILVIGERMSWDAVDIKAVFNASNSCRRLFAISSSLARFCSVISTLKPW